MYLSIIYKCNSIDIIIMSVHHRTLDIQFMIIGNCKINRCHTSKYSYQNDYASFSCILDCLPHCNIISCTIIDHICFIRAKRFNHCLSKIFFFCIYAYINSTLFCFIQTKITDICDHNVCCPHSFR